MTTHSLQETAYSRLPSLHWWGVCGGALLSCIFFVSAMEVRLALRGVQPALADSAPMWIAQRDRAGSLGTRALILVGGSRMQLAIDTDVARRETGLEPVQLAVDGSSFLPVLENLARDPAVRGTVLVDFADHLLVNVGRADAALGYVQEYERRGPARMLPTFDVVEGGFAGRLYSMLRSYADGAQPWTSLRTRLLRRSAAPQYLYMLTDRSRWADYTKVPMPEYYLKRVMRHLGQDVQIRPRMTWAELESVLQERIAALVPATQDIEPYRASARRVAALTAALQGRGARVRFLMLPKSGLIRRIDDRRYPRQLFWEPFVAAAGAPALHYEDVPEFSSLVCPDGSHLDHRDRARFTKALVRVLGLARDAQN